MEACGMEQAAGERAPFIFQWKALGVSGSSSSSYYYMSTMKTLLYCVGDESVQLFRYKQQQPPLLTITNSQAEERTKTHQALDETFDRLFGGPSVTVVIDHNDSNEHESLHVESTLYKYLKHKLSSAFQNATRLECHVTCARVTVGGFGSQWHHDADSHLEFDNVLCEYLAVYYLEPTLRQNNHNPWLECALNDDVSVEDFIPVSTTLHSLIIFRNDEILHRTPLLSNLVQGDVRRFFYIPFRALDADGMPVDVSLERQNESKWEPYVEKSIINYIEEEIKEQSITFEDYVKGNVCFKSKEEETAAKAERPNWLFDDPDDY
jgi:hypothetical protein